MKEKLAKLIDVKSIMTLVLTITYVLLTAFKTVPEPFTDIYKMIVIFYFGTQVGKISAKEDKPNG